MQIYYESLRLLLEVPLVLKTEVFAMDTYFIHSVLSNHSNHNDSSINFEQENQKELDSPWFVAKSLLYQNIIDIKGATSKIETYELLGNIKQSNPKVFNVHNDNTYNRDDEYSESEAEVSIKPKHKHLSKDQILKIVNLFNKNKKTRREISQYLFVSYSTIWRVIRGTKHDWDATNLQKSTEGSGKKLKKIHEKLIDKYIENRTTLIQPKKFRAI